MPSSFLCTQLGASPDPKLHAANNALVDDLTLVAQFGRIPVIIAGDLQAQQTSYPALASAINFQSWHDPISQVGNEGDIHI